MRLAVSLLVLASTLSQLAHAGDLPRTGYVAAEVKATRWADAEVTTVDLSPGAEVEVVAEAGALVRVRHKTTFGWVPAELVTDQAPVSAESLELKIDGPPSFR